MSHDPKKKSESWSLVPTTQVRMAAFNPAYAEDFSTLVDPTTNRRRFVPKFRLARRKTTRTARVLN